MLKKIVLHGFKSFSDRTEIVLGSGITAIVGPNGCGKSNIADALRWVLGEQNPRVLRCSKLQDLVFTGTESRKAMGMAEVRLLLDGVLGEKEREIVRRFYRDGQGEYRVNGKPCRWKDVVEALLGTGLSHTGYVVIGQGTIQDLAGGRPEDRRAWFEEASGVAKFRLDEREIEDKLSGARDSIVRVNDILAELLARQAQLEAERERARAYLELTSRREQAELGMWLYQFFEEERKIASLKKRLEKLGQDRIEKERLLEQQQARIREIDVSLEPLNARQRSLMSQTETVMNELAAIEKERDSLRGQSSFIDREMQSRAVRCQVLREEMDSLAKESEELGQALSVLKSEIVLRSEELTRVEAERLQLESTWRQYGEKAVSARSRAAELVSKQEELRLTQENLRGELDRTERQLVEISTWMSTASGQLKRYESEIQSMEAYLAKNAALLETARQRVLSLEMEEKRLRGELSSASSNESALSSRLASIKARKRMLEDMQRKYEGYGKGPRTVLEARDKGTLNGVIGSVGDLIWCDGKYIAALAAALGGSAEDIVTKDEVCAKEAIELLKKTRSGRATFLPLTLMKPRPIHPNAQAAIARCPGTRPLIEVLEFPMEVSSAVKYLVGRTVLADTVDVGLEFMKQSGWVTRVVTLGGEIIEPGGAMSGGDAPRQEAIFQRKQELANLIAEEERILNEISRAQELRQACEESLNKTRHSLDQAKQEAFKLEADKTRIADSLTRARSLKESLDKEIAQRNLKVAPLEETASLLRERMSEAEELRSQIVLEFSKVQDEVKEYEEKLRSYLSADRELSEKIQALSRERQRLQVQTSHVENKLQNISGEKASHERALAQEEQELDRLRTEKEKLDARAEELKTRMASLDLDAVKLKSESGDLARKISGLSEEKTALAGSISSITAELNQIAVKIDDLGLEIEALEKVHQETASVIKSKFNVEDPASLESAAMKKEDAVKLVERLEDEIRAFGAVNLKAEEEYRSLSERVDTMMEEKEDVEKAIEELAAARSSVQREIRNRFEDTFSQVQARFSEVFQELFGGGSGTLRLMEDSLGIEVIAEPPGRRHKQFNLLSGGERSLCGIALIFAILSVRPSPLIVLDEVDSALDGANVIRFSQFLKRYAKDTQFLVITHQEATMEAADIIYGVTMEEPGVSKVYGIRI